MHYLERLEFHYTSRTYYALLRNRFKGNEKRYHVTIMDSELENLLADNDIFRIDERGQFQPIAVVRDNQAKNLVSSIVDAFMRRVKPVLDGTD